MATIVNGARIDFGGYEYGIEVEPGKVIEATSFELMHRIHRDTGKPMKFRAVYRTEWWACTENDGQTLSRDYP